MSILAQLGVFIAAALVYYLYHCDFWGPLRRVPGPFWTRITNLYDLYFLGVSSKGGRGRILQALHEKHGPVVRLGPGRYSISDSAAAKQIYHHASSFDKSDFYIGFGVPDGSDLFSDQNRTSHANNRRRIASLYSASTLKSYTPFVDKMLAQFISQLQDKARSGQSISLPEWSQYFTFDTQGMLTFAEPFGVLGKGRDHINLLGTISSSITDATTFGLLAPRWGFVIKNLRNRLSSEDSARKVNDWMQHQQAKKYNHPKEPVDDEEAIFHFCDKVQGLILKGKAEPRDLRNVSDQNVRAGSDTTGNIISAIVWHLQKNPPILTKLRSELATCAMNGDLSDPISYEESQRMAYLQAVIKEATRMDPPALMTLPRVVPKGGAEFCGYFFPAGTIVGSSAWTINYDKDTFGVDASTFRPERWTEDPERAKQMEAALLTWGAGSRTCIGKNIAMLIISKVIPELIRHFDFELLEEDRVSSGGFTLQQTFHVKPVELEKVL